MIGARRGAAAFALFVLLAVVHTWPLASGLSRYSRHDNGDAMLNEWIVAWTAHQLPRNPLALFDANIFYPEPNTLAFSEHLFVQGVMGAPLLWAGVSTLVVHNLLMIAGLALSGWAMCLVIWRWTGDAWAGVLAGMLLAFNAHTLTRMAHLQAMHMEFLPLAMLALDRVLMEPRIRHAVWLAAAFTLQALASNYHLVFLTFALVAAALSRPGEWLLPALRRDGHNRRTLVMLAAAGILSVALLAPFLIQYAQAQRTQGLTRSLEQIARFSASWRDYAATGSRLHYGAWSAQFWRGDGAALFPGFTAIALAAVALFNPVVIRQPRVRMWAAAGAIGLLLSFGTALPGYEYLYAAVPLLQGIRATVRFGLLVLVAVAALAGCGLAYLRSRMPRSPAWRAVVPAAALLLVSVEAARMPLGFERPYAVPSIYRLLAHERGAVLIEMPFYRPADFHFNAPYLLNSTLHWKPIVNGYSGFKPESYDRHWREVRAFPDAASLDALRGIGVTHVAVSQAEFVAAAGQEAFDRIAVTPDLTIIARQGDVWLYRLERSAP